MSTSGRSIRTALRIRVSMSAIGSVIMAGAVPSTAAGNAPGSARRSAGGRRRRGGESCIERSDGSIGARSTYQLAFFTPGIRPRLARFRKQIRQMPNLR